MGCGTVEASTALHFFLSFFLEPDLECSIWCPSSFGSARVSCPGLRLWTSRADVTFSLTMI
jgi:hypothetical protein